MIVCANCNRAMRPKKNSTPFIELSQGEPYKLWSADLWECQDCGHLILYTDLRQEPITERWKEDFSAQLESYNPQYSAKDWDR